MQDPLNVMKARSGTLLPARGEKVTIVANPDSAYGGFTADDPCQQVLSASLDDFSQDEVRHLMKRYRQLERGDG